MRGRPKARRGKGLLAWRSRQKPGAIMKSSTFESIKQSEEARGLSEKRATEAAGASYWRAAKKKFKERQKKA
jgi:hypothetical protein